MATKPTLEELRLDAKDLEKLIAASSRKANQVRLRGLLSEVNSKISVAVAERAEQQQEKQKEDREEEDNDGVEAQNGSDELPEADEEADEAAADSWAASAPSAAAALPVAAGAFVPIQTFGWDQSDKFVSVYVSEHMQGVKASGAKVDCDFSTDAFDLKVNDFNGKSYRLTCRGLDKEIEPKKSKVKVKNDRIVVMLKKVPGEYGPDHWMDLVPKRKRPKASSADPTAGIMDMMKDMYDSGDDQIRKTIGEAMMKSQQQQMMGGGPL